ncbi:unnamed protein product [Camellia sinensis]
MASDLCIERKDSKWEIRDSPAKKQRCEDYGSPPSLCSSAEEEKEKEKEKEDPRSKVVVYNYDDSDVEDDSDGKHEFTDREYQEYNRQITESDRDAAAVDGGTMEFQAFVWDGIAHIEVVISRLKSST